MAASSPLWSHMSVGACQHGTNGARYRRARSAGFVPSIDFNSSELLKRPASSDLWRSPPKRHRCHPVVTGIVLGANPTGSTPPEKPALGAERCYRSVASGYPSITTGSRGVSRETTKPVRFKDRRRRFQSGLRASARWCGGHHQRVGVFLRRHSPGLGVRSCFT